MYRKIPTPLYKKYTDEVMPAVKEHFKISNFHMIPQIEKVIVNMGIRQAKDDKNILEEALAEMTVITGQKPVVTKARKAISNFTLRKGMPIGCKVVLRGRIMYEFLERLLRIAIPRIRDFSGLNRSFDRFGNLTIGIVEESIFPEVDMDKVKSMKGLSITVVTDKKDKEKSIKVLEMMGFPFAES
ncbi:MAG: 50S ribosomal protein L5 [Elusimicrobiota bacterium]